MPQKERLRVWNGELKKTAGGLTKKDLVRNRRGRIVSRKKSVASSKQNNLGKWLRGVGDSFAGKLHDVGLPSPAKKGKGQSRQKKKQKQPKPQSKQPKPQTKDAAKPKPAVKQAKAKPQKPQKAQKPQKKAKSPVKAGQLKNMSKISVGNIIVPKKQGLKTNVPKGWPEWTKKVLQTPKALAFVKDQIDMFQSYGMDANWSMIKTNTKKEFPTLKIA